MIAGRAFKPGYLSFNLFGIYLDFFPTFLAYSYHSFISSNIFFEIFRDGFISLESRVGGKNLPQSPFF